jgi:pimeloyl-ACP methyl ester carboxylesterase
MAVKRLQIGIVGIVAVITLLGAFYWLHLRMGVAGDFDSTPIVLVHGSGLSSSSWKALRKRLEAVGYPSDYIEAVDIAPTRTANELAAGYDIAVAVESVLKRAARKARSVGVSVPVRVDLVSHSMGAFSSRYFAAIVGPTRVRTLIAIAGSNFGTNALCHSSLAGDRQMCPAFAQSVIESGIQVQLNGTDEDPRDPSPYGLGTDVQQDPVAATLERCIAYYTLRIEPDEWIKPERSAMLPGAGGLDLNVAGMPLLETQPGNFLLSSTAIHDDLPSDAHVIDFVIKVLIAADQQWQEACHIGAGGGVKVDSVSPRSR